MANRPICAAVIPECRSNNGRSDKDTKWSDCRARPFFVSDGRYSENGNSS